MALSPSAKENVQGKEAEVLLDIADAAIVDGLLGRPPGVPSAATLPPALQETLGAFVTLTVEGALNGCTGSIEGAEPLGHAVARHAWTSAFADARFPALRGDDYALLLIEVSVLSPLALLPASSRRHLLDQLRPEVDGLVITSGARRALFLPSVWEQLTEPTEFLDHLQLKAGLPAHSWPPGMRAYRFTAERFLRRAGEQGMPSRAA
jgi:AmmeMemoRadiSam system protein A